MNSDSSLKKNFRGARAGILFLILSAVVGLIWRNENGEKRAGQIPASVLATNRNLSPVAATNKGARFPWFREQPLPYTRESANHQWTGADGRDPSVIRQLAHSEMECERMLEENPTIYRRQLVYRKQTLHRITEHSLASGEPIRGVWIPGLDGNEYQIEVRHLELADGGQNGTLSGHLVGFPDSMVTLAFKGGREAFTVISPANEVYLSGEPREPGEVIVKKIDPAIYAMGQPCEVH